MSDFVTELQFYTEKHKNHVLAEGMSAYMRNKFSFLGIKAPDRKILLKNFIKQNGLPQYADLQSVIEELWESDEREFQYMGMEIAEMLKKSWQPEIITLFEWMVVQKSWWDTTDFINTHLIGAYFLKFPEKCEEYVNRWMASGNSWLQRTCLIFQLSYKQKTNTDLLFACIRQLAQEDEFFIRKAIGWALRQYARTDAEAVLRFVSETSLKPLSKREALKHILLEDS